MQLEQVLLIVAVLCIALIASIIFISKFSYDEGYADGYKAGFLDKDRDVSLEYQEGYEDVYSDDLREAA